MARPLRIEFPGGLFHVTSRGDRREAIDLEDADRRQWHNRAHNRVGHVFQGRFKAIIVQREAYLRELARYVVLNPVRARMCALPEEWPWSSYLATTGDAPRPDWLDTGSRQQKRYLAAIKGRPWHFLPRDSRQSCPR